MKTIKEWMSSLNCRRIVQTTVKLGWDIDISQSPWCSQTGEQCALGPGSIGNRKICYLPAFDDGFVALVAR